MSWLWLGRWLGARQVQLWVSEAAPSVETTLHAESPEHPPFPCRSSELPWMDTESRTISKIPRDSTCRGLGGIPANWDWIALREHPVSLPRSSCAWLAIACEQLTAPCVALPLLLSHHVPKAGCPPLSF